VAKRKYEIEMRAGVIYLEAEAESRDEAVEKAWAEFSRLDHAVEWDVTYCELANEWEDSDDE
jgi:hypothetical protein